MRGYIISPLEEEMQCKTASFSCFASTNKLQSSYHHPCDSKGFLLFELSQGMVYSSHCFAMSRSHLQQGGGFTNRRCQPQTSTAPDGSLNQGWTWRSSLCWNGLKAGDAQQGLVMAGHRFIWMWKKRSPHSCSPCWDDVPAKTSSAHDFWGVWSSHGNAGPFRCWEQSSLLLGHISLQSSVGWLSHSLGHTRAHGLFQSPGEHTRAEGGCCAAWPCCRSQELRKPIFFQASTARFVLLLGWL